MKSRPGAPRRQTKDQDARRAVAEVSARLLEAGRASPEAILQGLGSRRGGLAAADAAERLERLGRNETAHETSAPWYRQLLGAFVNPFIGILAVLAVTSYVTEVLLAPPAERDASAVVIIVFMIAFAVLLTFAQEYRASRAADELLSLVQATARVRRDGELRQVATAELVSGDVVRLAAGDAMPADVYLLEATNLLVNEASLTGESLPVEKRAGGGAQGAVAATGSEAALDLETLGYMGTYVVSGTAEAVILATGGATYFGSMARELVGRHPPTSFDRGVRSVSVLLIRFMLVMVPLIFVINGLTKGDWWQALLFGLAVAVGLTPEMLPMVVSANLAKGALEMSRRQVIMKHLGAIQNLGAMDVLCTDKTGTLSEDDVGLDLVQDVDGERSLRVLEHAYLNAYHQTGLRNPLDDAVVAFARASGEAAAFVARRLVAEIPFETTRRRLSVIVEDEHDRHLLICKGAAAEVLAASTHVERRGATQPLTRAERERLALVAGELTAGGLRVLLVAYRSLPPDQQAYRSSDERDLTVLGFVGFLDPAKPSAGPAITALERSGVAVRVITGDNEIATRRICADIGFEISGVMEGQAVDALDDAELQRAMKSVNVFVRMAPLQKSRVIAALKAQGHTVGFLGDGINDAPALRDADVGISVDNAVDIAKESADVLLLEKDLLVLDDGIATGRRVFGNTMKYVKITASSNFGNVFSVLVASAFLPFPPMLPLHLLIQNLLYDVSQASIPWDHVDEEYVRRPRSWSAESIARFMLVLGPVSSIFDFTTFALLWYVFAANTAQDQALFHSGWFVLGLLSQTLIVHMIRTTKVPFVESMASWPVLVATGLVMIVGVALPLTGYGEAIGLQALPTAYFPYLVLTLLAYCLVIQLVKGWYIRRYGTWL